MGVSCVQSIAISDGRSGQQIIDTISKQLESMNGRKCGTYCVESDTYYSSAISPVKVLNLLTSTEFPMTCFALLNNF
jgi:mediator of RNA polymerase II transcription subunit 20